MKRIIVITYSLFLFFSVSGQIEPPVLEFNDLTPNWLYISKDSNFIKSELDPFSSPYWGRQPIQLTLVEDKVFVLERMQSQSPYTGIEGYLLHCLDSSDGVPIWINHNNSYSGYTHREFLNIESFRYLENDEIEILTYRDIDSIDFSFPQFFGFHSSPKRKIINADNGEIVNEHYGDILEINPNNFVNGISRVTVTGSEEIVQLIPNIYNYDNTLRSSVELYNINTDFNIVSPLIDSIEFDTDLNISESASFVPNYFKLNQDTMIAMFAAPNPEDFRYSPSLLELRWVDISSVNSFGELSRIDIVYSREADPLILAS